MHSLYIAWRYLRFNGIKTATIILCVMVIISLPLLLKVLVDEAELQLRSRAIKTPLLIGKAGSAMDLVLSSLYFTDDIPASIPMSASQEIMDSGLAKTIPLYRKFRVEKFPVVGSSIDYFAFRDSSLAQGRLFLYLGECVVGSAVATQLNLHPGNQLLSSPDNLFDLAGSYPLKMTVAGILAKSHSMDDHAVFVDIKTAWVIEGLGHGHQDLDNANEADVILSRNGKSISANAKLMHYNEITQENMKDFHFHGDMTSFPVTAFIAIPEDAKAEALLKGKFIQTKNTRQIVKSEIVINTLLEQIFQVKKLVDGATLVVSLATLLALTLVFALSIRLREQEFDILFKIGCVSTAMARLLFAEILLVLTCSFILCGVFLIGIWWRRDYITQLLLFN